MSWEIIERRPKFALGIIHIGITTIDWSFSFKHLKYPVGRGEEAVEIGTRGLPFDAGRNDVVKKFLKTGADWLFFYDSDLLIREDAIINLISHKQPIISGLYFRKHRNPTTLKFDPLVMKEGKNEKGELTGFIAIPLESLPSVGLQEVDTVPAGMLLVHRRVFEAVPFPWFQWSIGFPDRPPFQTSEDFYFGWKARQYGFRCFVDVGVRGRHILHNAFISENGELKTGIM